MRRALVAVAVLLAFPGAASAQVLPPVELLSGTVLTSTGPERVGETLRLTAAVTSGVPVLGGTVEFHEIAGEAGSVVCDDVLLVSGSASCDVVPKAAGTRSYIAQYSGTSGILASVSQPLVKVIQQAPITVTAPSASMTYGQPLPSDLTATVSGAAASLVTGKPACSISGAPVNAGVYDDAITCSAGTLDVTNFVATFVPGDLTIAKAPAVVTANPVTMTAGGALPALTASVAGLVGSDTLPVTCAGPASVPAQAGTYAGALNCVADSLNYAITFVPGTLTVLASTVGGLPGGAGNGGGSGTTTNTTNNVTNVGIIGGGGGTTTAPKVTLSLLTKKVKRAKKATLKLRSSGAISSLKLALKRDGKTVGKGSLATLNGAGSVTLKASKKLKKGLYTLQATWAGGGKKRFNLRVR